MAEPPTRSPALYRGAPGLTSAPRAHAGDTAVRPPLKARPCPTRESEGKPFPRRSPSWERRKERVPPWRHSRPQVAWDRGHRARPRRCPRVPAGGDGVGTGVRGDGAKRMEWGCVRGGGSAHVGMFPLWGRVGSPKAFGGVGERWDTAGSPRPQGDEKAGAGRARAELCGPSKSPVQQEGAVRADGGPWAGENPPLGPGSGCLGSGAVTAPGQEHGNTLPGTRVPSLPHGGHGTHGQPHTAHLMAPSGAHLPQTPQQQRCPQHPAASQNPAQPPALSQPRAHPDPSTLGCPIPGPSSPWQAVAVPPGAGAVGPIVGPVSIISPRAASGSRAPCRRWPSRGSQAGPTRTSPRSPCP